MSDVHLPPELLGHIHVVMPCAGVGARAAAGVPKQYARIGARALVAHTLAAFAPLQALGRVVVVLAPDDHAWPVAAGAYELLRQGGDSRAASVRAGLQHLLRSGALPDDWVMVHDAARCLLQSADVMRLVQACVADAQSGGAGGLLALPLADTLKQAGAHGRVQCTLSRDDKWLAQTPQMFRLGALLAALSGDLTGVTDEASAMERAGIAPLLVPGPAMNFKVTYPEDFALAHAVLSARGATTDDEDIQI